VKITYLLNCFPNISETFISDEIYTLVKAGTEVEIFSLQTPEKNIVHDNAQYLIDKGLVHYLAVPSKKSKLISLLSAILTKPIGIFRLFRAELPTWIKLEGVSYANQIMHSKPQFIHSHFADKSTQIAHIINIVNRVPYSFTTHGYDVFFEPPDNYMDLVRLATFIYAISNFNAEYLHTTFLIPKSKILVNYCGIDLSLFTASTPRLINKALPIKILTIARLHAVKGHKVLLEAMASFKQDNEQAFELWLAGDGPLRQELEAMVKDLRLQNEVKFLGNQSQSQVRELISSSDLFVLPSLSEGLPICLMEAMAGYLPVIAPDLNGIPELIANNENGLLFERGNAERLKQAITQALSPTTDLLTMAEKARHTVEQSFSIERNVRTKFNLPG
jgi:glycosyltransferase involved in cell wall biosynthesis